MRVMILLGSVVALCVGSARAQIDSLSYTVERDVLQDGSAMLAYFAPHWMDSNDDGDASDGGERHFPVTYVQNTLVKIDKVEFDTSSLQGMYGVDMAVKGVGPDNDEFYGTAY